MFANFYVLFLSFWIKLLRLHHTSAHTILIAKYKIPDKKKCVINVNNLASCILGWHSQNPPKTTIIWKYKGMTAQSGRDQEVVPHTGIAGWRKMQGGIGGKHSFVRVLNEHKSFSVFSDCPHGVHLGHHPPTFLSLPELCCLPGVRFQTGRTSTIQ